MRLMLLGGERTGKTSLLQAFKRESLNINNTQQNQRVSEKNFIVFGIFEYF
jgi:GTPase SAR1 family protein